ncbi:MAG: F0F1 ATP synthase subunit delta [Hydrogenobacter sp.]|uniref:F0F1 ATP synthase subunit delta n=1 Tax=Hydrogenobacter thermophilus TaxID=940 RepID=UPI0030FB7D07
MIKNVDLARKLSKMLISSLPKEKKTLLAVSDFLGLLSELYRKEKSFRDFMINPLVPSDAKLSYLKAIRERLNILKEIDTILSYIIELNAFPLISEIKRLYDHEVEKTLRFSKAFLILAKKTDGSVLERIREVIGKLLGRELEFEVTEDASLIGGFVVKTYGFLLDASVKKSLQDVLRS